MSKVTLPVQGMHCAGCVGAVEAALAGVQGVRSVAVSLPLGQAVVEFSAAAPAAEELRKAVERAGYQAGPPLAPGNWLLQPSLGTSLTVAAVLTLPVFVVSMAHVHFAYRDLLLLVLTLPVLFYSGLPIFLAALLRLRRGSADMNSLIALGTLAALVGSVAVTFSKPLSHPGGQVYFESAAVILTLVLLGRWLEERAQRRARSALTGLLNLRPAKALLWHAGQETEVPLESVAKGDLVILRPGERVPVDGTVQEGHSAVNESMLTGESLPVRKQPGDKVFAGSINGTGLLKYQAEQVGAATRLARIIQLVEEAQANKARVERLADRLAAWFVPSVLVLATTAGLYWGWADSLAAALRVFIATLVIACPCALGLATPLAVLVGTGRGAELGILIRGGTVLERAGQVGLLLCDKTGTLTAGQPTVHRLEWLAEIPEPDRQELLRRAGTAESRSHHPWAKAITAFCPVGGPKPEHLEELPGLGIKARFAGEPPRDLLIGSAELLQREGVKVDDSVTPNAEGTQVLLAADRQLFARFLIDDPLRAEAQEAVAELRREGLDTWLVTGDQPSIATRVAERLGIGRVLSGVKPEGKAEVVRQAQATGVKVAFLGDGINDAPALAAADLGMAMGGGTDAALEAGDVVLLRGDLRQAATAIRLARRTLSVIRENLVLAFAYNTLAIPLAMADLLNPMIAAGAMTLSSLSVVANSLRLRRFS